VRQVIHRRYVLQSELMWWICLGSFGHHSLEPFDCFESPITQQDAIPPSMPWTEGCSRDRGMIGDRWFWLTSNSLPPNPTQSLQHLPADSAYLCNPIEKPSTRPLHD
jgi:hypothetical protein